MQMLVLVNFQQRRERSLTSNAWFKTGIGLFKRNKSLAAWSCHAKRLHSTILKSSSCEACSRAGSSTRVVVGVDKDKFERFALSIDDVLRVPVTAIVASHDMITACCSKSSEVGAVEIGVELIASPPIEKS